MTIHDILLSCGSVRAETLVFIIESGIVKKACQFKDLEPTYEILPFKIFTVSPLYIGTNTLAFKFYV